LKPTDFFTANPSIDVPSNKNFASQLVENGKWCSGKALTGLNGSNGVLWRRHKWIPQMEWDIKRRKNEFV